MGPAYFYLAYLLFSASIPLVYNVSLRLPVETCLNFCLATLYLLIFCLSLTLCLRHGYWTPSSPLTCSPDPGLSRFERRHAVYNVFIKGLRTTVLLRTLRS